MKISESIQKFKWFYLLLLSAATLLAYADFTGWRILSSSNQETWSASGPSGHK